MREKLITEAGHTAYARRTGSIEPVHGQNKQARGFREFHVCGLAMLSAECTLVTLTHNLLELCWARPSIGRTDGKDRSHAPFRTVHERTALDDRLNAGHREANRMQPNSTGTCVQIPVWFTRPARRWASCSQRHARNQCGACRAFW